MCFYQDLLEYHSNRHQGFDPPCLLAFGRRRYVSHQATTRPASAAHLTIGSQVQIVKKAILFVALSEVARSRLSQCLLINDIVIERGLPCKGKTVN